MLSYEFRVAKELNSSLWTPISRGACSSAWLERIPDKDEAGGSSPPRPTSSTLESRGISSAGRAPALQAGGQRFDPAILHQAWMFGAWSDEQVILKGWPVYYSIIGFLKIESEVLVSQEHL